MKHMWLVGALTGVLFAGTAAAQTQPTTPASKPTATQGEKPAQPPAAKPATPTGEKPAQPSTAKPAQPSTAKPAAPAGEKPAAATGDKPAAPRRQAAAAPREVPTGEAVLGTISIPRGVTADGKPLSGGRYTVRLTAQAAQPTVAGQLPDLNRWVEFVQGGQVRGREVVSIIPADEVDDTQQGPDLSVGRPRVPRGSSRVEALKGGDYIRVWFNTGGHHYLVHLPPQGAAAR